MKKLPVLFMVCLVCALAACKKDSLNEIPASELKPDDQVSLVKKESYVNRVYIDLLGRKPTAAELQQAIDTLNIDNAGAARRTLVVNKLFQQAEYNSRLYINAKAEYLNGTEDTEIQDERNTLEYARDLAIADNNSVYAAYFQEQMDLLDSLLAIPSQLQGGTLDMRGMHMRMVNNSIYDGINMGVANFTFAVFESFLFRQPTTSEWASAQTMCNGQKAVIFNQAGYTKADFIQIVFSNTSYYEGQVTAAYLRFMGRKPNSSELYTLTTTLVGNKDFEQLYLHILTTDEYFGI